MRVFYLATFLVLNISFITMAQNNFKPGYIVNFNNDTTRGLINYKEWLNTPREVEFKTTLGNKTEVYSANSVTAFGIDKLDYFERFLTNVSLNPVDITAISRPFLDTALRRDTIFLHVLFKGERISLYSYTDLLKTRYYIKVGDNPSVAELGYRVNYDDADANIVRKTGRYKGQLAAIAGQYHVDDDRLKYKINGSDYNERDLTAIVKQINGRDSKQLNLQSQSGYRLLAGAAIGFAKINFSSASSFASGTKQTSFSPDINIAVDLYTNKNTKTFYFRVEAAAMINKFNFPPSVDNTTGVTTTTTLSLTQTVVSVMPQVFYDLYTTSNFKLFIGGGGSVNFASYSNYNYAVNYGSVSYTDSNKSAFKDFWLSLPVKAGVRLGNRIEVNAEYIFPAVVTYGGALASYHVGINYLFGK